MARINLLLLQVLVAVISVALWYMLTTYPVFGKILLPPFFFSNPVDVAQQVVAWFVSGVIWKHLWVTLSEFDSGVRDRLDRGRSRWLLVRTSATHGRGV